MSDLSYVNTGNGHAVYLGSRRIGRVHQRGLYWVAYGESGELIHGTFGSMSAAGQRVADVSQQGPKEQEG